MKATIILLITVLALSAQSFSQQKNVQKHQIQGSDYWVTDSLMKGPGFAIQRAWSINKWETGDFNELYMWDSTGLVILYKATDTLKILDTLQALKQLSKWFIDTYNRQQEQIDRLYEAENVLNWITIDGKVSDKKRFRIAVERYLTITQPARANQLYKKQ